MSEEAGTEAICGEALQSIIMLRLDPEVHVPAASKICRSADFRRAFDAHIAYRNSIGQALVDSIYGDR